MKIKLTNMLRGKEKKNRYAKLSRSRSRRFIYILKINCIGKRTVGKANERINVEKIVIDLKIKIEN